MDGNPPPERAPWRVLLTTRWIFGHLLALTLITLFITAGFWQAGRLGEKRIENEERAAREELPVLELGTDPADTALVADPENGPRLELRPATATGTWDPASEVLRRGRSLDSQPGWHVLTPFVLEDGNVLLIDRGWVPYDSDTVPVSGAEPPEGTVTVTGTLREPIRQERGFAGWFSPKDPPEGTLEKTWHIDPARLEAQLPGLLQGAWLQLDSQEPEPPRELPVTTKPPPMDDGPHLGYAIQWFAFALVGIIGYALLMRHILRDEARKQEAARQEN